MQYLLDLCKSAHIVYITVTAHVENCYRKQLWKLWNYRKLKTYMVLFLSVPIKYCKDHICTVCNLHNPRHFVYTCLQISLYCTEYTYRIVVRLLHLSITNLITCSSLLSPPPTLPSEEFIHSSPAPGRGRKKRAMKSSSLSRGPSSLLLGNGSEGGGEVEASVMMSGASDMHQSLGSRGFRGGRR